MVCGKLPQNLRGDNNQEEQNPPMDGGQGIKEAIHILTRVLRQQRQ